MKRSLSIETNIIFLDFSINFSIFVLLLTEGESFPNYKFIRAAPIIRGEIFFVLPSTEPKNWDQFINFNLFFDQFMAQRIEIQYFIINNYYIIRGSVFIICVYFVLNFCHFVITWLSKSK